MTFDKPLRYQTDEWFAAMREIYEESDDVSTAEICAVVLTTPVVTPSPPQRAPHPRPAREQPMAKGRGPEGQPAGVHGDSQPSWLPTWLRRV